MVRSSLNYGGIFSPKSSTKKAFHGEISGKNLWRWIHGGANDQIISR